MNTLTSQFTTPSSAEATGRRELLKWESEEWDAIVVGAGPAGGLAARQLASMGCKTLLVDKCAFPRSKVCGGCLNGDAVATLHDLALGHLASDPHAIAIDRFRISCDSMHVSWNSPAGAAISRATFDDLLVTEATSSGATFLSGTRATVGNRIGNSPFRDVVLHSMDGHVGAARGRIVIVADGLHQMSIRGHEKLRSIIARGTRIGMGATLPAECLPLDPGTVRMTIHAEGYVGIVRIPGDRMTIAAAVDAGALHRRTPAEMIERLLGPQQVSARFRDALHEADWRGTGPLTRSSRVVASDDILLVGDASGYVEPFTGEGMAWSFRTAAAVASLVTRSLQMRADSPSYESTIASRSFASETLACEWISVHRGLVGAARRRCRAIAWLLRHPRLTHASMRLLRTFPGLAEPLVQSIFSARHTLPSSARTTGLSTTDSLHPRDQVSSIHS